MDGTRIRAALLAGLLATAAFGCWREPTASQRGGTFSDVFVATEVRELTRTHIGLLAFDPVTITAPISIRAFPTSCPGDSSGVHQLNPAGIPRDQVRTYDCTYTLGQTVFSKRGSVRVQALGDNYAVRVTYSQLRVVQSLPTGSIEASLNGEIETHALDDRTLEVREQVREGFDFPGGVLARHRNIVHTISDTLDILRTRYDLKGPSSVTIAGSLRVVRSQTPADTLSLAITTPTPLKPDRACLLTGGFRSGELHVVRQGGPPTSFIIPFTC